VALADPEAFGALTRIHRRELLVHCYRMLGSVLDAEDVSRRRFCEPGGVVTIINTMPRRARGCIGLPPIRVDGASAASAPSSPGGRGYGGR